MSIMFLLLILVGLLTVTAVIAALYFIIRDRE